MSDELDDERETSAAIARVVGVRNIFSGHPVSSATLSLVTGDPAAAAPSVRLDRSRDPWVVTARLALDRAIPTATTLHAVLETLDEELGNTTTVLTVEVALLE